MYLALLGPLLLVFILLGPRFFDETRQFIIRSPYLLARILDDLFGPGPYDLFGAQLDSRQIASDLFASLRDYVGTPGAAFHVATSIFEFLLQAFLSLIVSIYLLLDSDRVNGLLMGLVPADRQDEVARVSEEVHRTLALYLRRQMLLVVFVATVTFLGLEFIFHLHYSVAIAVATGFVEIVPFFGPVTAGAIAALVALSQGSTALMVGVIVFYIILRQVEDQIVMPVVLGRAVALHPVIVIFAILAGGALAGVIGTLVAVPVAASIKVVLDAWPRLMPRATPSAPPTVVEIRPPLPPSVEQEARVR
jgi:predicted PurR-regulated permease PerM